MEDEEPLGVANPSFTNMEADADGGEEDDVTDLSPTSLPGRPTPSKKMSTLSADFKMEKMDLVLSYWKQKQAKPDNTPKKSMSREAIQRYIREVLHTWEVESKESVKDEVNFITTHFKQRRCKNYCRRKDAGFKSKTLGALRKIGLFIGTNTEHCECGYKKNSHTGDALKDTVKSWSYSDHMELLPVYNFGNLEIPGHFNYLDSPTGTRKYIRLDDVSSDPKNVWKLLTKHWKLRSPNLVISITGGDVTDMKKNINLHRNFRDGIIKSAVTTHAWVMTEGLCTGASKEIGDIFQEDLRKTEWSEKRDHASIPLIAVSPWGILADRKPLYGIHVGLDETKYVYQSIDDEPDDDHVPNALDPHHTVYLLTDEGTSGRYNTESRLRNDLEEYIKNHTALKSLGSSGVKTPLILILVGGDKFTLEKVQHATSIDVGISVVIVNDSGPIADAMAEVFKAMESQYSRHMKAPYSWTDVEENFFNDYVQANIEKLQVLVKNERDREDLKEVMRARHLIEVFGVTDGDVPDLDKAILNAIFGGLSDITVQLTLTLAMDRCDVAEQAIFIESRKHELRSHRDLLQNTLYLALRRNRSDFVRLLLDQDYGGELDFRQFLTVQRLYQLHEGNLQETMAMGKLIRSMCKRDHSLNHIVNDSELLPQIGRVIYQLMGSNYRLLYQNKEYRTGISSERELPHLMSNNKEEEAVWHLLIWAVLSNQKEVVELFIFETSCKLGAALLAFKLFSRLAGQANRLSEGELALDLKRNADYFEDVASSTLNELYDMNRHVAYCCLVSVLPFHLGRYVTPLSLADDAKAMRFVGQSCCQTFLLLVWNKYMDVDTSRWKLFPLFALFPFLNLPFIVFDKRNLNYGGYQLVDNSSESLTPVRRQRLHSNARKIDPEPLSPAPINLQTPVSDYEADCAADDPLINANPAKLTWAVVWFKLYNYYTAPVCKFVLNFVSYLTFLIIFTLFLLSHLAPVTSYGEVHVYEKLVTLWVIAIVAEEIKQILTQKSSGPLYELSWIEFEPEWSKTWHWYERLGVVIPLYPLRAWFSDYWNRYDCLMLVLFITALALRIVVSPANFGTARIFFTLTIMAFYFRLLRFGYILQTIGPRIITIAALLRDLLFFLAILLVFIVSFGVAFQAIVEPRATQSFDLVWKILYRPYWQTFGDLFLDDITEGMGLEIVNRSCVHQSESAQFPGVETCVDWMPPVMLAIFMLITNILLLNLLIAIFSHSFDTIQAEAETLWKFHLYGLVHEYYHFSWLPYPLNLLCHVANVVTWLSRYPRKWAYKMAVRRVRQRLENRDNFLEISLISCTNAAVMRDAEDSALTVSLESKIAEEVRQEPMSRFFYDNRARAADEASHLRQEEFYRDEDLEEKAFKRYLRLNAMTKNVTDKKLDDHNARLQTIASELQELKHMSATGGVSRDVITQSISPLAKDSGNGHQSNVTNQEWDSMKRDMRNLSRKMEQMDTNLLRILSAVENLSSDMQL